MLSFISELLKSVDRHELRSHVGTWERSKNPHLVRFLAHLGHNDRARRFKCGLKALRIAMISAMVRLGSDAGRCGKHWQFIFSDHLLLPEPQKSVMLIA